jgi:hypothetical protein
MKIRAGFVSNSSSTSFLILAADDLTQENFFKLMGVNPQSPLADIFRELHEALLDGAKSPLDLREIDDSIPVTQWLDGFREEISPRLAGKLQDAKKRGLKVYYGQLDSESSQTQTFFCCDSFEVENEKFYINALECAW